MKDGESEIKHVQFGKKQRPAYESATDKNNRGGTEYQTATTICEEKAKILQ